MTHFRHHIGGAALSHGSTAGISQAGTTGRRVYIDPARGRGEGTEIRAALAARPFAGAPAASISAVNPFSFSVIDTAIGACDLLTGNARVLCLLAAAAIPGGDEDVVPGGGGCTPPLVEDEDGQCRSPGSPADIDVGGAMGGSAVMGRYGAALAPATDLILHRDCLPGMVLGDDNLCYNRGSIRNSDRKWPRGTRPLGTPGEMAALRKAATFGRRMETTVKRMQKIGVLKKAAPRKAAPKQLIAGVGHKVGVVHE